MKVAYATQYEANDIRNFSGLVYYIAQAIQQQDIILESLGPLDEKNVLLFKGKQFLYSNLLKKQYLRNREPSILKHFSKQLDTKLSKIDADLVFSPSTVPIAYLDCIQPVVFWTDATFSGLLNFYPKFFNLCQETIEAGHEMEKLALEKSKLAIYSSDWAAQTAIETYQVNPSKVKVVPFGANVTCNRDLDDIKALVEARSSTVCNLLFLAVDWLRKGGDIALEVTKELNRQGLNTRLTIVGCQPPATHSLPDFVDSLGFISKSSETGLQEINRLFSEAHFLILPSLADCTPVVFCEANSFGVPCLATNVGGIPTVIRDGVNGKTFSQTASIEAYCTYIANLFSNYSQYKELAFSSFHEYQSRLNWTVAGQKVKALMTELVA